MSLYTINKAIEDLIDMETGEIKDIDAMEQLQMAREEKVHNICAYIINLDAEAKSYGERAAQFDSRRKAAENKAENLRKYLQNQLAGQKWKDEDFTVSFRTTKATDIFDEDAVPIDYKIAQAPKLDRAGILRTLKMGKEIPGARLVERESMTVK